MVEAIRKKEKSILNDEEYDLEMKTLKVSVSDNVLSDIGWYELSNIKKVGLTKEEVEWFERHKDLPFFSFDKNFITEAYKQAKFWSSYERNHKEEEWAKCINRLSKAYFLGYTLKNERMFYIKLNFLEEEDAFLNVKRSSGEWIIASKYDTRGEKTKFSQSEIDEMQLDSRSKGLDLNELKIDVRKYDLEVEK